MIITAIILLTLESRCFLKKFMILYIYDCFPDPSAMSGSDMNWFIHNDYTTLTDLKNCNELPGGEKRYKNLGKLEAMLKDNNGEDDGEESPEDNYRDEANRIRRVNSTGIFGRFLVRRMYTRERWITIVPKFNLVIEERDNPYDHKQLPIHTFIDHVYPNQLYGIGEIEPIKRMQKALKGLT